MPKLWARVSNAFLGHIWHTSREDSSVNSLLSNLSHIHAWNVDPRLPSRVRLPTRRVLTVLWILTVFAWSFTLLVLSIGFPEWQIYPDPQLEGLLISPVFWISVVCWVIFGQMSLRICARWGGEGLATFIFAALIMVALAFPILPHLTAGFYPGLGLGVSVEGTLYYLWGKSTPKMRGRSV